MNDTQREAANQDVARFTRAWQDGVQAMFGGVGEQWRRMAEAGNPYWSPRLFERAGVRENLNRILETTREVTNAQVAVAGELLRVPFWVTGAASPADLQARYFQLFNARRELARAYLDAALGWQRALTGAAEEATETAKEVVDAQVQTARRLTNDARDAQQATVEATRKAAATAQEATNRVVNQAREVVEEASERVEEARRRAEREQEQERRRTEREQAEQLRVEVATRLIKGNINREGEKIYHLPGQSGYDRVQAEESFATEEEAQSAGFRRSQASGGGTIKGKINREGEKIYHLPGQANYDRLEADMIFETEEQAQANGFRPAQR